MSFHLFAQNDMDQVLMTIDEDEITVSIAADTIGIFNFMFLVKEVEVFTSRGITSEYEGTRSTSS